LINEIFENIVAEIESTNGFISCNEEEPFEVQTLTGTDNEYTFTMGRKTNINITDIAFEKKINEEDLETALHREFSFDTLSMNFNGEETSYTMTIFGLKV